MPTSIRQTTAFIPPAEYQTPSPYRPPYTPPSPSINREPSPARPVPDNLHQYDSDAFNVDPDAPFLASAGPARQSPPRSPSQKKFVGGFVANLKKAMPHGRRRLSQSGVESERVGIDDDRPPRDSGYGGSTSRLPPPTTTTHPEVVNTPSSASVTLQGHVVHEGKQLREAETRPAPYFNNNNVLNSPGSLQSPQYFDPEYGSDYARMSPPSSINSFRAYVTRVQQFFRELNELPWVATERVTVDYYPGRTKRSNRISRVVSLGNDRPGHVSPYGDGAASPMQMDYSQSQMDNTQSRMDNTQQMDYTTSMSSPSTHPRDRSSTHPHPRDQDRDLEVGEFEPRPNDSGFEPHPGDDEFEPHPGDVEFEPYPSMHDVPRGVDGYPRYPNGYVSYPEQQNYGMQYGRPVHMSSTFPMAQQHGQPVHMAQQYGQQVPIPQPHVVYLTTGGRYPYSSVQAP